MADLGLKPIQSGVRGEPCILAQVGWPARPTFYRILTSQGCDTVKVMRRKDRKSPVRDWG